MADAEFNAGGFEDWLRMKAEKPACVFCGHSPLVLVTTDTELELREVDATTDKPTGLALRLKGIHCPNCFHFMLFGPDAAAGPFGDSPD